MYIGTVDLEMFWMHGLRVGSAFQGCPSMFLIYIVPDGAFYFSAGRSQVLEYGNLTLLLLEEFELKKERPGFRGFRGFLRIIPLWYPGCKSSWAYTKLTPQ